MSMSKLTFKNPAPELTLGNGFHNGLATIPMTFKLSIMIIVEPVSQKLTTKHDRF